MNIEIIGKQQKEDLDERNQDDDEEKEENLDQINEELERQYISRSELIKNLKFPRSTDKRVIILPNNEGLGFRYDCYNPQMLGRYISEKEFKDSVYELTKICSLQYASKLKREKNDPFYMEKKMLLWNIPLLIIAILLFSLRVFDTVQNNFTFEIGIAFYGVGMLFVFYNFIKSQIRKPDMTSFEVTTHSALQLKIVDINKQFISRGINWILHPKFYWIEIQIV